MQRNAYYLEQLYFDNGTILTRVLPRKHAIELGYFDGYYLRLTKSEIYVDVYKTYAEAVEMKRYINRISAKEAI